MRDSKPGKVDLITFAGIFTFNGIFSSLVGRIGTVSLSNELSSTLLLLQVSSVSAEGIFSQTILLFFACEMSSEFLSFLLVPLVFLCSRKSEGNRVTNTRNSGSGTYSSNSLTLTNCPIGFKVSCPLNKHKTTLVHIVLKY